MTYANYIVGFFVSTIGTATIILQIISVIVGIWLVGWTLQSAIRAFVLPRSERVWLQRFVFQTIFTVVLLRLHRAKSYEDRDRISAIYAPIAVLTMPFVCLSLIVVGYTLIYWGLGITPFYQAFLLSGSSLYTLGFDLTDGLVFLLLIYSEATLGLGLAALLVSYLPTMYGAFSRRERAVAMLEIRAGDPPSPIEMIKRFNRLERLDKLDDFFSTWEEWFADVEESHTSLSALVFFRSPQPNRSWLTSAGVVMDGAAIYHSCVVPEAQGYQAALAIRGGYIALRRISDFFNISYDPHPQPTDDISITFEEFTEAYDEMAEAGVPLKTDVETAWQNFRGWRVNYDTVLIQLANLTLAPYARWISDRSLAEMEPLFNSRFGRFRAKILGN